MVHASVVSQKLVEFASADSKRQESAPTIEHFGRAFELIFSAPVLRD